MSSISSYQVGAALWVVRAIGGAGVSASIVESSFHSAVTQGRFPRPDLNNALQLLISQGLLTDEDGLLRHHESLAPLLALSDDSALGLLTELLDTGDGTSSELDQRALELLGELGEEAVIAWCVAELKDLGHQELAPQVQRVSLVSDRFGFDVSAPLLGGGARKLEVKTTSSLASKTFRFFLTRNEYEVGRRSPRVWALVACGARNGSVELVGWCRVSELERYLPDDADGRWTEALVNLPVAALLPNAPSAIS